MTALFKLPRRAALGSITAGLALAATPGRAAGSARIDFSDPADRLRAYMLMRGALDERLCIGCVQGQYFAVIDGALTPLFGLSSATFARHRRRADGGYDVATGEVAYFTDLASGEPISRWTNPWTGEAVSIPRQGLPPTTFAILPDLTFKLSREMPGGSFTHRIQPAQVRGDDVWIAELTTTSVTIPGQGAPRHYSEMTTLHCRHGDLERRGVRQVGADTGYTNVLSWRGWMKMGAQPGHMMAIGSGRYGATMATLPPALIAGLRADRPELLADPASLIDPLWK